jgi:hypothetical protein
VVVVLVLVVVCAVAVDRGFGEAKVASFLNPSISRSVSGRADTMLISNLGLPPLAAAVAACLGGGAVLVVGGGTVGLGVAVGLSAAAASTGLDGGGGRAG